MEIIFYFYVDRKGGSVVTERWLHGGFHGEEVKSGFTQSPSVFMIEVTGGGDFVISIDQILIGN
jgi:hypothetical protein